MAGAAASELSRGGMNTKIEAGKIATAAGTAMIIAAGNRIESAGGDRRGARSTFFRPSPNPVRGYKTWIAGQLEPAGRLHVDAGAVGALLSGKTLLPAGVTRVSGDFSRGDTVAILDPDGREIARGLVAYDAADAVKIAGLKSAEIDADARLCGALGDDPSRRHGAEPCRGEGSRGQRGRVGDMLTRHAKAGEDTCSADARHRRQGARRGAAARRRQRRAQARGADRHGRRHPAQRGRDPRRQCDRPQAMARKPGSAPPSSTA